MSFVDLGGPLPSEAELAAYQARLEIVRAGEAGRLFTFGQWLAARPFGDRLPTIAEARMMEIAFTAALRWGRDSSPPLGPVPGDG